MKKLLIGLTISAAVFGGFVLAQSMTSGAAANQEAASTKLMTEQEAKDLALKEVNGTIKEAEFDGDEKRPHYEFDIQSNQEEVSVEVDAETGKVTITEREVVQTADLKQPAQDKDDQEEAVQKVEKVPANSAAKQTDVITKAEAIKSAKTVAKGTVTKAELDKDDDDSTAKYELEFKDGNIEYDVEVDAYTGKVLEVDQDVED